MKRRTFLQHAGVLLTGATAAAGAQAPQQGGGTPHERRPTVLLTSPQSDLGAALAAGLDERFEIRRADAPLFRDEHGTLERALSGVNAIVHGTPPGEEGRGGELLDLRGRGTYDLLTVAASKGIELVVYLSSLEIMAGYDPSFQVAEDWRPVPTSDAEPLSHYLAECTCREFAREKKLREVLLRLGAVVRDDAASKRPFDPPWVHQADAVQAVSLALEAHFAEGGAGLPAWTVLHVAADAPGGRFPVTRAKRTLGYQPQFNPGAKETRS